MKIRNEKFIERILFRYSLWTIDFIAKVLLYALLLWAFLSYTGLKQHVSWFFTESQGFLKQS